MAERRADNKRLRKTLLEVRGVTLTALSNVVAAISRHAPERGLEDISFTRRDVARDMDELWKSVGTTQIPVELTPAYISLRCLLLLTLAGACTYEFPETCIWVAPSR